MFIFYLIFGILLIGFILSQFILVFFEKDTPDYQRYINVIIFVIILVTTVNLIIAIVAYIKTRNMIGHTGDPGIRGSQGTHGNPAICSNACGQKTCYINVIDYANKIFNEEYQKLNSSSTDTTSDTTTQVANQVSDKKKINNRQFLRRLNKICHSNQYKDILVAKHNKKPNEKKLIEYIKKIIAKWVKIIVAFNPDSQSTLDNRLGIKFLLEKNFSEKLLNSKIKNIYTDWTGNSPPQESPFKEIEKYDIWEWSETYKTKRNVITINSNNLDLPEPDQPTLSIIKSNNYQHKFKADVKNDIWDDTFCPHNQMGDQKNNPNNLDKCVFIDKTNGLKEYKDTWKKTEYNKPKGLSLYNPGPFKSTNNQVFYPVGSVWRGKNETNKPTDAKRSPDSINMCGKGHGTDRAANFNDFGPEKETILVSGDVKSPIKYEPLWNSEIGCSTCHTDNVKVWRPIPPKGYTCLGDVTTTQADNHDPKTLNVKCVPSKCVQEKKMGSRVWNNRNVAENTYNNYKQYYKRTPANSKKSINVSVWSAGASNSGEENVNLYGTPLDEDGGYNLFRVGKGLATKPEDKDGNELKTYVIKNKCLIPGEGKKPVHPQLRVPADEDTNVSNDLKYNDKHYFGKKPAMGIVTNIDTTLDSTGAQATQHLHGPTNKSKKLYLIDDLNKRKDKNDPLDTTKDKSDSYFLKTFNEKNNDFSSCLATTGNKQIIEKSGCNKSNPHYQWRVRYDTSLNAPTNSAKIQLQTMKDYKDSKQYCLQQYYDNQGKNQYNLKECDNTNNTNNNTWKYNTLISQKLPQQNESPSQDN